MYRCVWVYVFLWSMFGLFLILPLPYLALGFGLVTKTKNRRNPNHIHTDDGFLYTHRNRLSYHSFFLPPQFACTIKYVHVWNMVCSMCRFEKIPFFSLSFFFSFCHLHSLSFFHLPTSHAAIHVFKILNHTNTCTHTIFLHCYRTNSWEEEEYLNNCSNTCMYDVSV